MFLYLRNVVLKEPEANLSIDSGATLGKKISNSLVCLTEGVYRVIVINDWVTFIDAMGLYLEKGADVSTTTV